MRSLVVQSKIYPGPFGLSARQLEVLRILALGENRKESAQAIGVSAKTVEFHIAKIKLKLNIPSDTGLVRFAIENGLVKRGETMQEKPTEVPRFLTPEASTPHFKTTADLAQALLDAAAKAAAGKADAMQVTALCQCTNSLIDLARLQLEVTSRGAKVPWLEDKTTTNGKR